MTAPATVMPATTVAGVTEYVTFRLADLWMGIPVMTVQEVLVAMRIAPVPLAPEEIAGFLNLRGQIVTAIDLRRSLRLEPADAGDDVMNVVVRHHDELFALMVDEVGDVVSVPGASVEPTPVTLDPRWRAACSGIVRRTPGLLLILSVPELLRLDHAVSTHS